MKSIKRLQKAVQMSVIKFSYRRYLTESVIFNMINTIGKKGTNLVLEM